VVYDSRKSAVADAERIYPFNNGIKVIHLCCAFPPPDLEG